MKKETKDNLTLSPRSPEGEASRTSNMHFGAEPSTFKNAQYLRDNETPTEKLLWQRIKNNQTGVKFRRQHPIGNYIADFYCHRARLVLELDGDYHDNTNQKELDNMRDKFMNELGIHILRFVDDDIINDIESVIKKIKLSVGSPLGD